MDRHVIANMGAELGATTSVFPSDERVEAFLKQQGREDCWRGIAADENASYEEEDSIDLSQLEPLIACPTSPGNVVPVSEVAGRELYQAYIGSSANPGCRDFAVPALMVDGKQVHARVSFDINPTSRQILENLIAMGLLAKLIRAGARLHQAGCNGCIGHGPGAGHGQNQLAHGAQEFPRALGHQGRSSLSLQPRDRHGLRTDRRYHRSAHARHGIPLLCRARADPHQRRYAGAAPAGR